MTETEREAREVAGRVVEYRGHTIGRQLGDDGREVGLTGSWMVYPPRDEAHSMDGAIRVSSLDEAIKIIDASENMGQAMTRNQIHRFLEKANAARLADGNRDDSWIRGFCDALIAVYNYDCSTPAEIDEGIEKWKYRT